MSRLILQFGDFELNCARFQLLRRGRPLRVERKPLELLILLAEREGELVTRSEIAARLWSTQVFVDTDHGINTAIRKLRHLMRDGPDAPRFIQTVTGKGYRFVAPVTRVESGRTEPGFDRVLSIQAHGLPDLAAPPAVPKSITERSPASDGRSTLPPLS